MEREIQISLIKTSEKVLKNLIFVIFKLVFKLKQWPDFNGEDEKLMKDFKSHIEVLQTTTNCKYRLNIA